MPVDPVDTREHDLAGCRRRHGHVGPAAGLPCDPDCGCVCHNRHAFEPDGACAWPADNEAPDLTELTVWDTCGQSTRGHMARSPVGEVMYELPICWAHMGEALGAGWHVWSPSSGAASGPTSPRAVPDPVPALFPPGQAPRGVLAPLVTFTILGAAAVLVVGSELWDEWQERRRARATARAARHG